MKLRAFDEAGLVFTERAYYSVGGGFVVSEELAADGSKQKRIAPDVTALPLPFQSGGELLAMAREQSRGIAGVMRVNERHWRTDAEIDAGLMHIWHVMQACVRRGCSEEGVLPGGYKVKRRAPGLLKALTSNPEAALRDPLQVLDWVNLYALAVNEENAAGGQIGRAHV